MTERHLHLRWSLSSAPLLALTLACCGGAPASPVGGAGESSGTGQAEEPPIKQTLEELEEANKAQFEAALEPAEAFLKAADPVAAASIGKGELNTPPLTMADRADLAEKLEAAARETSELDAEHLSPPAATGLAGIRFALDRERDAMLRRLPTRTDPTEVPRRLGSLLDEIETRVLLGIDCGACGRALERAAVVLPETSRDLTAFSPEGATGGKRALESLEAHARRLAAYPELTLSAQKLAEACVAERAALEARVKELDEANNGSWTQPPPLRGRNVLLRLPAPLGLEALRRRLGVEEGIALGPKALFEGIEGNLDRYAVMLDEQGDVDAGAPSPLTVSRCEASWQGLVEAAAAKPALPKPGALDCARLAQLYPESIDDAALDLLLIDVGFIDADRRAFRASQQPTISLVSGRLAPPAQRTVRRINFSAAMGRPAATALAIRRGQAKLCQAGAALWEHAALGEPSELDRWLTTRCPTRPPEQWRADALQDPRGALSGLLLGTLSAQPMDMVRLDRFWWAPAGQQRRLVDPGGKNGERGAAPNPSVRMDEIPIDRLVDPDFVPDWVAEEQRNRAEAEGPVPPAGPASPPPAE